MKLEEISVFYSGGKIYRVVATYRKNKNVLISAPLTLLDSFDELTRYVKITSFLVEHLKDIEDQVSLNINYPPTKPKELISTYIRAAGYETDGNYIYEILPCCYNNSHTINIDLVEDLLLQGYTIKVEDNNIIVVE